MRIVTGLFLEAMAAQYTQAATWLKAFIKFINTVTGCKRLVELPKQYPHADSATVASGKTVVIFNVAGNEYRLITATHFNTRMVFTLRFFTHADYSENDWKNEL